MWFQNRDFKYWHTIYWWNFILKTKVMLYSQTCFKQSPLGGTQSDVLTEMTFELRLGNLPSLNTLILNKF